VKHLAGCSDDKSCEATGAPQGFDCGKVAVCGEEILGEEILVVTADDAEALSGVTFIKGKLTVSHCELLDLEALEDLRCVSGWLYIHENSSLSSLAGLQNLKWVGGDVTVGTNDVLTDLTGLNGLESVGDYLQVSNNDSLVDLTGLESLTSVSNHVSIAHNASLVDLTGLNNLFEVGNGLYVAENEDLISLNGLESLSVVQERLLVADNTNLPTCEATDLYDGLADQGFDGMVCIYGNLVDGCDDIVSDDDLCYE
jgi:hypothetical protein